jgi:hypothetical protein
MKALVPVSLAPVASNGHEAELQHSNGSHTNGHAANGSSAIANGNGYASMSNSDLKEAIAEQTEVLRELLRRVGAIEEKMPGSPPRARRFLRIKR